MKLHWRDDLQDKLIERDLSRQESFERLLGERGIGNDTTLVLYGDKNNWFAAYAYWYLKIYGHEDVAPPQRRSPEVDRRRPRPHDEDAPRRRRDYVARSATSPFAPTATRCSRGSTRAAARSWTSAARSEYSGELLAPPGYEQEGAQRGGPHPRRPVDPLGDRGTGRRHVQEQRKS